MKKYFILSLVLCFVFMFGMFINKTSNIAFAVVSTTDQDKDGLLDTGDNCPSVSNPDQADADNDGIGDACDETPNGDDSDDDGVADLLDNCPLVSNTDQANTDGDSMGDACDETPNGDTDQDSVDNDSDNCPSVSNQDQADVDVDGVGDVCDNSPYNPNPDQEDSDGDKVGNVTDNCPLNSNSGQQDDDGDGLGNVCDQYNCRISNDGVEKTDGVDNDCDGFTDENNNQEEKDYTNPVITVLGNNPVTIKVGGHYKDAGATALDNIDGNITSSIEVKSNVDTEKVGTYMVTYDVMDSSGNEANQMSRTVIVEEGSHSRVSGGSIIGNIITGGSVLGSEKFFFTKFLKMWTYGDEVMELQKFLNNAGFGILVVDGKFGPLTKAAVIKFQIANELVGDGIVGPLTRAVLNK